jgi:hypothetical protein
VASLLSGKARANFASFLIVDNHWGEEEDVFKLKRGAQ